MLLFAVCDTLDGMNEKFINLDEIFSQTTATQ